MENQIVCKSGLYGVSSSWIQSCVSRSLSSGDDRFFKLRDPFPTAAFDADGMLQWLHRSSASKPARLATPASLVRRRQRELSSRRAHALRSRRAGESSNSDAAGVSSRRQRGRRRVRPSAAQGLNDARASSSGVDFARKQEPKSGHLSREEEIEVCRAIQVCTCCLLYLPGFLSENFAGAFTDNQAPSASWTLARCGARSAHRARSHWHFTVLICTLIGCYGVSWTVGDWFVVRVVWLCRGQQS